MELFGSKEMRLLGVNLRTNLSQGEVPLLLSFDLDQKCRNIPINYKRIDFLKTPLCKFMGKSRHRFNNCEAQYTVNFSYRHDFPHLIFRMLPSFIFRKFEHVEGL
uniref:Uncharacterized protein n=1 Tax=Cacopsylla melanoneura TaxID=428564 RepID=A0A8D9E1H7_9HEMI